MRLYLEDMSNSIPPESFLSLRRAAARLGVPIDWLRREAQRGDIPCLRVGRRMLFNVDDVERSIRRRIENPGDEEGLSR